MYILHHNGRLIHLVGENGTRKIATFNNSADAMTAARVLASYVNNGMGGEITVKRTTAQFVRDCEASYDRLTNKIRSELAASREARRNG